MEALRAGFDFSHYLTVYMLCRVFPLSKTKNGYYKCRLIYNSKGKEEFVEWAIPAQYLEENGHFETSQDVYYARFHTNMKYEIVKDENGNEEVKQIITLGRMIEFWNTRVYGMPKD